jgi:hypothetical protein
MSKDPAWQQRQSEFFEELPSPSNAVHLKWSDEKLKELRPEFYGLSGFIYTLFVLLRKQFNDRQFVKECLDGGDGRAAVVMSVSPLLVAAYSDELDGVAMLQFPDHFVQKYGLQVGTRLLTVNNYGDGSGAMDLIHGPKKSGNWDNIIPTIAEFASDDLVQIEQHKRRIPDSEWQRAFAMGRRHLQSLPGVYRDGRPFLAGMPRAGAVEYEGNLQRAQQKRMLLLGGGGAGAALLVMFMCCGIGSLMMGGNRNPPPIAAGPNFAQVAAPPQQFQPGPMGLGAPPGTSSYAVGERVEAQWGGRWAPAEVLMVRPGGFVVVRIQPGLEPMLPPHLVRKAGAAQ